MNIRKIEPRPQASSPPQITCSWSPGNHFWGRSRQFPYALCGRTAWQEFSPCCFPGWRSLLKEWVVFPTSFEDSQDSVLWRAGLPFPWGRGKHGLVQGKGWLIPEWDFSGRREGWPKPRKDAQSGRMEGGWVPWEWGPVLYLHTVAGPWTECVWRDRGWTGSSCPSELWRVPGASSLVWRQGAWSSRALVLEWTAQAWTLSINVMTTRYTEAGGPSHFLGHVNPGFCCFFNDPKGGWIRFKFI